MGRSDNDRLVLFVLWLVVFSFSSQMMIIAPILPQVGRELAVTDSALGSLVTVYAVAAAVVALLAGPVSDALGRQRILWMGTVSMTVALLLHGVAWDFPSLLGVRALAGVAGGMLAGASVAYVGDYFPPRRRGWANGWVMSGLAAGQILGIPMGTVLADWFGFRSPFLAFALVMAVAAGLILFFLPRIPVQDRQAISFGSAVAGYRGLLRRGEVLAAVSAVALMFLGISLYITYFPAWLESSHAVTGTAIAALFFFGGVGNAVAGPQAGRVSDRIGRKRLIVGSSFLLAVVMVLTLALASTLWAVFALFVGAMALLASRASPFQAMLTEMVPAGQRGSLMSLNMSVGQVGFGIGGALAGPLYVGAGYEGTLVVAAAVGLVVVPLAWRYFPETVGGEGDFGDRERARAISPGSRQAPRPRSALAAPEPETDHESLANPIIGPSVDPVRGAPHG